MYPKYVNKIGGCAFHNEEHKFHWQISAAFKLTRNLSFKDLIQCGISLLTFRRYINKNRPDDEASHRREPYSSYLRFVFKQLTEDSDTDHH
jgi:hypothetical protein